MHAYLIVAHSEFTILQRLVNSLDDERNDIYIHYDKKVKNVPVISTKKSKLFMCSHRVDVRWGHVSMIKAEYVLLEEAYKKGVYLYYHIISGVHFPLKSQNFLHCFFDSIYDNSVLMEMETTEEEYDSKIKKFNFCIGTYIHKNRFIQFCSQLIWRVGLRVQKICRYSRKVEGVFKKASVWCSLTDESVAYLISKKSEVLHKYKYSFCGDEYFVPSELWNSPLRDKILFYNNLLKCDFSRANTIVYTLVDFNELVNSNCLFVRKVSSKDLDIVQKIEDTLLCGKK